MYCCDIFVIVRFVDIGEIDDHHFLNFLFIMFVWLMILVKLMTITFYPLANEGVKGYSNATVRPSFRPSVTILVNTLGSTSFNGF